MFSADRKNIENKSGQTIQGKYFCSIFCLWLSENTWLHVIIKKIKKKK